MITEENMDFTVTISKDFIRWHMRNLPKEFLNIVDVDLFSDRVEKYIRNENMLIQDSFANLHSALRNAVETVFNQSKKT